VFLYPTTRGTLHDQSLIVKRSDRGLPRTGYRRRVGRVATPDRRMESEPEPVCRSPAPLRAATCQR